MTQPSMSDWSAARGEKWAANLDRMEAMLKPVDEPLIRAANLDAPYRIADIACGGGGTTFEILGDAPSGSVVHGFDIAPASIALARGRIDPNTNAVAFEVADLEQAVPEEGYDRLISRFGVMFFRDPAAAFGNLLRWLMPGGRFAFALWARPDENPWHGSVRNVVAEFVDLPQTAPDSPGPFRYGDVDALLALLRRAGYGDLDVHTWRGKLSMGGGLSPNEAANFALEAFSTFNEALLEAGPQIRANAHEALAARFSEYERDGVVHMDARVNIVTGVRPTAATS